MKIVKIVLIVLALAIAGVLALAAARPDTFRVERSASIKAPPARVDMDRMVGGQFEAGLANLKVLAEK